MEGFTLAAIGAGIAVFGAAYGIGKIGSSAMEAIHPCIRSGRSTSASINPRRLSSGGQTMRSFPRQGRIPTSEI